jgi:hypothetical protein
MAMELFVLSDRRLGSIAEWQGAIDAEGFALRLSAETPFEELDGFLPARLGDKHTGFECDHWDARELTESPKFEFDRQWAYALSFRFGGIDIYETPAAHIAGATYAAATDGVVLDLEVARVLSSQQALEAARDIEQSMPWLEGELRRMDPDWPSIVERIKSGL